MNKSTIFDKNTPKLNIEWKGDFLYHKFTKKQKTKYIRRWYDNTKIYFKRRYGWTFTISFSSRWSLWHELGRRFHGLGNGLHTGVATGI
ncbi:MAG TPA: hypothetical protein IAA21_02275 [Candidatus Blautia faecigallinarum]|uniref:Uncharacterized protein n=1 Tax=Candidatus Blautia faecigallinarum TaxID=2838488 RepID=A0A9D2DR09_9FIRM|nr:hypothetical protein [Candidatus Blautia faecigallinarum]